MNLSIDRLIPYPTELYEPFLSRHQSPVVEVNIFYPNIQKQTTDWAVNNGLVQSEHSIKRFIDTDFPYLASVVYPYVGEKQALLISEHFALIFLLDDFVDEDIVSSPLPFLLDIFSVMEKGKVFLPDSSFLDFLDKKQESEFTPFKMAYSAWWKEISSGMSDDWKRRYTTAHLESIHSVVTEKKNRTEKRIPPLDEYILLRRKTSYVRPCLYLVEVANELHSLTNEIFEHPIVKKMEEYAIDLVCFTNDLISCDKEYAKGEVNNIVVVYHNEKKCESLQKAAKLVIQMLIQKTNEFKELFSCIPNVQDIHPDFSKEKCEITQGELKKYFEGCWTWAIGNYVWSLHTERYKANPSRYSETKY